MYSRKQKAIDLHQPRLGALEEAQRLRSPISKSVAKNLFVLVSAALWEEGSMKRCANAWRADYR